mmetsp:Transcript_114939/g.215112  ORF Transcript_114939/g.215112 Transcript_114939/m.215112 type:complete len:960 (+) Transcript_114939:139-3018(+)
MSRAADVNAGGRLHPVISIDDTRPDVRLRSATPPRVGAKTPNLSTSPTAASASGADSRQLSERQRLDQLCFRAEREGTAEAWARVTPLLYTQLRETPSDAEAWSCLARGALAQGRESEALRAAQEAMKLRADVHVGHALNSLIAQKCLDKGDWERAVHHAEAALASQPSDMQVLELLAKALFKQGNLDRTEAAMGVLARCSSDRGAALACSFAKDSSSSSLRRHHWLTLAASWGRGSGRPLRELGEVCLLMQRDQEAIHWFHKVLAQNPTEVEVALKLAQMHLRSGHGVEEALEVYRMTSRAAPDHYALHRQYGQLLLKERRASEAAEVIRIAARLAPPGETAALYVALAELQQSMGLVNEALRAWEAAVTLDEGNIPAWRGLALAAAARGEDRLQLRALKQLNGREPQNAEWLARLGTLLTSMNSLDEARENFSRALQLNSAHPAALLGLAQLSSGTEAVDLFERAARADPSCEAAVAGAVAARQQVLQQKRASAASVSAATSEGSSGGIARAPAAASPEAWRDKIADDQPIEVYSKSAGTWISGSVVQTSGEMVKLKYLIDGHWCEKVLLKNSEFLRLPSRAPEKSSPAAAAVQTVTPAQPARAAGGYPGGDVAAGAQRSVQRSVTPPRGALPGATPSAAAETPKSKAISSDAGKAVVTQDPAAKETRTPSKGYKAGITAEFLDGNELIFGKVLGSGGFGAVYRGTYRGEEVAIKKLHVLDGNITKLQIEEFKKECSNLQTLRHERLVSFIGAAVVNPSLCIVTEFMPNGSLYDLLHQRKQKLTVPQSYTIAVQISEGVDFLHSKTPPFVHRDLKSLNVVLNYALCAKLCDFGLTQSMEKTHISRRENEGGSPRYMAPELFDSKGKITEKVDVWALGCLTLEVYAGRVPHEECSTIQQVMIKTLVDKHLPFIDWTGLHPELRSLAEQCFLFDPRKRIDAPHFLEGLRALNPERSSSG